MAERHEMTLTELGWGEWNEEAAAEMRESYGDVEFGRVAADHGKDLRVLGPFGDERVALAGRLRFGEGTRPAVGDFVALVGPELSRTIVDVLPRQTRLVRQAAGKRTELQLIAANLDHVFVVTSFNEDFNLNRTERYLVAVRQGGAEPVVVVNKSDLVTSEKREAMLQEMRERLDDRVDVIGTSVKTVGGLSAIEARLAPGVTASFVGSSGVGKSSIVNQLLAEDRQEVFEVREFDDRGRHTTTHRELFLLDDGAMVIDTPGMREFQLWDEVVDEAFDDIAELGLECRFRDCQHEAEPGCAVKLAVEEGEIDPDRLESWRKLQRQAQYQARRQDEAARRDQGRELAKVVREVKRRKKEERQPD